MGLRERLARVASRAAVPTFAIAGAGARERLQDLLLDPRVDLLDSPRPANILLLAGAVPPALAPPALVAHDAMSLPRRTIWWRLGADVDGVASVFPDAVVVEDEGVVPALLRTHRELLAGTVAPEPAMLPDVDPAPWRGIGPYGQGGAGMTGGVPYGRVMPERAEDRDGLMLDQLAVRVGPHIPSLPPGLTLDARLQGDVVQAVDVASDAFAGGQGPVPTLLTPFLRALQRPVPIGELELARARSHLRWVAWALRAHGLVSFGERVLRLVHRVAPGDGDAVRSLTRSLRRTRVLGWSTRGVGVMGSDRLRGLGLGPVARACGIPEDVRTEDRGYRELGFEVVVHDQGDAAARWRQRLDEAAQSLDLAARGVDRTLEPAGGVEGPRGRLSADSAPADRLVPLLPAALVGLEWGDVVTTLASIDLDLEEASVVSRIRAGAPA